MIMTIGNFHSVLYLKKNVTGYIQYYKKWWDIHKGHGSDRIFFFANSGTYKNNSQQR